MLDRGRVHAEQPATGAALPGLGPQRPDGLVTTATCPAIRASHRCLRWGDELATDRRVALVVADHEQLRPGTIITVTKPAGGDRDFLDH